MNNLEKKVEVLARLALCEDESREPLLNCLRGLLLEDPEEASTDYPTKVRNALVELGMPDHVKGHRYIMYALERIIEEPELIEYITKGVYPEVAIKFHTTVSRVERAIRHAIEVTWDRADLDTVMKYFGNTIHPNKGKPTNSEFLSRMANMLK